MALTRAILMHFIVHAVLISCVHVLFIIVIQKIGYVSKETSNQANLILPAHFIIIYT